MDELVFLPIGGVSEIGMNLSLYGYGPPDKRKWLIVDFGITFPSVRKHPGVDIILPDIRFLKENVDDIVGMVITHAHEDHYGALLYLWPEVPVPVYMTKFSADLLKAKAAEESYAPKVDVHIFSSGETFSLHPFVIETINVAHSIPEAVALAISTPLGIVLHTGDWKIDPTPMLGDPTNFSRLKCIGEKGVLALVCDSTNVTEPGSSPSTKDLYNCLLKVISEAIGRVAITTFASNVERIKVIAEVTKQVGRKLVVLGRAMKRIIKVATKLGMLDGLPEFLDEEDYQTLPRDKVAVLMTGSQGEPCAALSMVSMGAYNMVSLDEGDTVIFSSHTIPGNEEMVSDIVNRLAVRNVNVITDQEVPLIHVSGHPKRDEIREMYEVINPPLVIPVHGEQSHIKLHAEFAKKCGVADVLRCSNGVIAKLAPGKPKFIEKLELGRIYKDGRLLIHSEDSCIIERQRLSLCGVVVVSVVLSRKGYLLVAPDVVLVGVPSKDVNGECFKEVCIDTVVSTVDSLHLSQCKKNGGISSAIEKAVKSEIRNRWGKRPMVQVMVLVV